MYGHTTFAAGVDNLDRLAWQPPAAVSGSNATNATTGLLDITGLVVALQPSSTYEFEACLSANSPDANGIKLGVNFTGTGSNTLEAQLTASGATSTAPVFARMNALASASAAVLTANADGIARITGRIVTGTQGGNLSIQHLKVTSGTSTVYIGSVLRVRKVA